MNDFLSNLIERNYADVPLIRPRVPSLFEPASIDDFEKREFSSPESNPELSAAQKIPTKKSVAPLSDPAEEDLPKPRRPKRQASSNEVLPQAKHLILPVASSRATEDNPSSAAEVSGNLFETRVSSPTRHQDLSPVEKRSSTSAQVIRVTIGRVEVHAVHSPVPAPKSAKNRAPKLSLEGYLRKRERGLR
jgi:hypothetical protein